MKYLLTWLQHYVANGYRTAIDASLIFLFIFKASMNDNVNKNMSTDANKHDLINLCIIRMTEH